MNKTSTIKAVLRERGIWQYRLAERMGIKPQSLSKTLRNDTVSDDTLQRIVKAANALTPHLAPLTIADLQTNEAIMKCPHCGKEIVIKIEKA